MNVVKRALLVNLVVLCAGASAAHVAEQGFVLLLPTTAYTLAGVAAVALTVLALFVLPASAIRTLFTVRRIPTGTFAQARTLTSLISFALLGFAVWVGLTGPRDPLSNVMPLWVWTLGWVALVSLAGLLGNVWSWVNPWTGPYHVLGLGRAPLRLPEGFGQWPAVILLGVFAAFLLVDPAPSDPARLAMVTGLYWLATMAGLVLFGRPWLQQVELGHALIGALARLAPLRLGPEGGIGGPGWRLRTRVPVAGAGVFALTFLAVGSFDGLNETFWWLALIGVNPLEFPGRTAVMVPTFLGLLTTILGLIAVFWATIRLGQLLAPGAGGPESFGRLAECLLPIALAYHIAHYLPSFLVSIQYTLVATSDPFATGADLLGLQPFYVTTGFFNRIDSVRLIWLSQAGAVVIGHVWSVLLSHRIALDLAPKPGQAMWLTLPLSVLMIAYTFLGLWLLAAPRGA
ncbi:MAG: hypothetical protein AAF913_04720 [Pseudomonadota bacterium]